MTDKEMEGVARQALNMAIRDEERDGCFGFLLGSWFEKEGLRRMAKIEDVINRQLGRDWLNHEVKKEAGFGLLRMACSAIPPDGLVLVTATNVYAPTEKYGELSEAERERYAKDLNATKEAARRGYYEIRDSLTAIVQTKLRVCIVSQIRGESAVTTTYLDQADFGGRLKMFGADEKAVN